MDLDLSMRDLPTDDGWRALAGVGIGYAIATGLIFALFFILPYVVLRAL
ncbi:hypothetical protein [Halorubrum lipolyticum]|uniref:Uncharacterized protein n=1 Tax=Halorubrum lipolyticum DSM 21995 TaxID=1227482 RepID=M0NX53_9EURY|nr:hypothetical protein [Halorubrum lipolyticum]EMA61160.1 hypothetical protein C469_07812 [Halorubrum lipolyticum DSM 21995]